MAADTPLPRALARARLAELAATPDSQGLRRDVYDDDDGGLKDKGKVGELNGLWQW